MSWQTAVNSKLRHPLIPRRSQPPTIQLRMTTTRSQSTSRPQRLRRTPERYQPTNEDILDEIQRVTARMGRPQPQRQQEPWWMYLWVCFALLAMGYFVVWSLHGAVLGLAMLTKWLGSFTAAQLLHGLLVGAGGTLCYLIPIVIVYPHVFYC